jgi:GAF domain-containing protein/HAMP domain-containing protein
MTGQSFDFVPPRGTLRRRMTLGFGVAAFLILLAVVFFFWQLATLRGAIQDLREQDNRLVLVLEAAQQAANLVLSVQNRMAEGVPAAFVEDVGASVQALESRQYELSRQLDLLPEGDPTRSQVEGTIQSLQNMVNVVRGTIRHVEDGNWPAAEMRAALLLERQSEIEGQVGQLVSQVRDRRVRAEARASEAMARIALGSVAPVVVALFIGTAVILTTVRSIALGVERLSQSAQWLAEGHLGERITGVGQDELGRLAHSFNMMAARLQETVDTLEERVAERTAALARRSVQLEASAQIAREAAAILDVDRLMDTTVRLISERFRFYHAGIFLLDERGAYAVLQAASSEGGQRMLAKGHQLKVGEVGIVGYAAGTGMPRIALDVGADAVFFDNPDLPDTRSEMALPLVVGERVIGVLDVQSTEEAAFSDEDVATLQTVADQVALAIEHARLLDESQRALQELEAIYGRRVREAWGERAARQSMGYHYTGLGVNPVPDPVLAELGSIPLERWPVVLQEADGRRLVAPIRLRGQTLGSVVLRQDAEGDPWSEDDVALVEELVTQVGLALENARLLEETRRRAAWEQSLSQLTARFSRSLDLDTMLQAAVRELGQLPNVAEVSVHVGVPEEQPAVSEHDEGVEADQAADRPHVSEQL